METVTIELTVRQARLARRAINRSMELDGSISCLVEAEQKIVNALAGQRAKQDDLQAQLNELRETIGAIQRDLSEAEKAARDPRPEVVRDRYSRAEEIARIAEQSFAYDDDGKLFILDEGEKGMVWRPVSGAEKRAFAEQNELPIGARKLSEAEKETIQSYALKDVDLDPGDFITDMAGNVLKRG